MGDLVDGNFNRVWKVEQELKSRLEDVLYDEFGGKVSNVAVIGVLQLLIADIVSDCTKQL